MKTTADQFRRLMPTLQHLARFPHCNRTKICERDGVALADVEAALVDMTDGSPSIWDEDCLAEIAKTLGVKPGDYRPAERPHVAPAIVTRLSAPTVASAADREADAFKALIALKFTATEARNRVAHAAAGLSISATTADLVKFAIKHPAPAAKPVPKQTRAAAEPKPKRGAENRAKFIAVCRLLLEQAGLINENHACKQVGIPSGSFCLLKKQQFGLGKIHHGSLRAFVTKHAGETAASSVAKPRRRLSKTSAAPAAGAAPLAVRAAAASPAIAGAGLLGEMLQRALVGPAELTQTIGEFRLELNLRLVPISPG